MGNHCTNGNINKLNKMLAAIVSRDRKEFERRLESKVLLLCSRWGVNKHNNFITEDFEDDQLTNCGGY